MFAERARIYGRERAAGAQAAATGVEGDRDPATWRPVLEWTAVKVRRHLTVDATGKGALTRQAAHCTDITVTVGAVWLLAHSLSVLSPAVVAVLGVGVPGPHQAA